MKKLMIALAAVLAIGAFTHAFADNTHSNYGDGQNGSPDGFSPNGNATGDTNHSGGYGDAQNTASTNTKGNNKGDGKQP